MRQREPRRAAGRKLHVYSKTRTRLTTSGCSHAAQKLRRRLSPTLIPISKRREIFSERRGVDKQR